MNVFRTPFRIGRKATADVDYTWPCKRLSGLHAELRVIKGELWIHDRGSSNGTFVNRRRIDRPTPIREGDIVHLATSEFVVGRYAAAVDDGAPGEDDDHTQINLVSVTQLPQQSVTGTAEMRELLAARAVSAVFQPIVSPGDTPTQYFEMLGRGTHTGLPASPYELFRIAAEIERETELSRLFAAAGFADVPALPAPRGIFFNLHPSELGSAAADDLIAFLACQRARWPDLDMVAEVHESAVLVRADMMALRARLAELDIKFAYDDFGAGQARLLELTEVPWIFQFDRSMICAIDEAPATRHKLLSSLLAIAAELGITCLAEGVETVGEWETCRQLGFAWAQGYHFGKPAVASHWIGDTLPRRVTARRR